jgi:hypothetical protein
MDKRIQWEYCQADQTTVFFYRTQERISIGSTFVEWTKMIAQLGLEGWELISIWGETNVARTLYFKRPVSNEELAHE